MYKPSQGGSRPHVSDHKRPQLAVLYSTASCIGFAVVDQDQDAVIISLLPADDGTNSGIASGRHRSCTVAALIYCLLTVHNIFEKFCFTSSVQFFFVCLLLIGRQDIVKIL